jgi:hypothetical protein
LLNAGSELLLAGGALFDHDDLAVAVVAAARANVVRSLGFTTVVTRDQVNRSDEDVSPPIALPMSADPLFG